MRTRCPFPTLFLLLLAILCGPSAALAETPGLPAGEDFGAGISLRTPTKLADLVASPERYEGTPVLVQGRVSDVCQRKGCWTVIRDGEAQLRVRFQDYGFFLPKDASGREAWVEGVVQIETLSEGEARHYAEESEQPSESEIHGSRQELGFTASGVRLLARP
jgi:hypothetical protein